MSLDGGRTQADTPRRAWKIRRRVLTLFARITGAYVAPKPVTSFVPEKEKMKPKARMSDCRSWSVAALTAVFACVISLGAASCTTVPEEEAAGDSSYIPCETAADCPTGSECVDFVCIG